MIKDALSDDEPASQRSLLLALLLVGTLQNLLQALHVIVVKPANGTTRDLETLLDGKINTAVRDNNIATLAEGGYNRGDSREGLCIDDSRFCSQEVRDVLLELDVDICRCSIIIHTKN